MRDKETKSRVVLRLEPVSGRDKYVLLLFFLFIKEKTFFHGLKPNRICFEVYQSVLLTNNSVKSPTIDRVDAACSSSNPHTTVTLTLNGCGR